MVQPISACVKLRPNPLRRCPKPLLGFTQKKLSFLTIMFIMIIIMVIMAIMFIMIISAISLTYTLKSKLCEKLWRALNAAAYAMQCMICISHYSATLTSILASTLVLSMTWHFGKEKSKLSNYRKDHKIVDGGKLTKKRNRKKKWMIRSSPGRTRRKNGWYEAHQVDEQEEKVDDKKLTK